MKKIYLLTILYLTSLLLSLAVNAQTINGQELRYYADQLVEKKILTPDGAEMLVKKVTANEIEVDCRSTVSNHSYISTTPAKESILQFCAEAFAGAQMIRLNQKNTESHIIPEPASRTAWTISMTDFMGFGNIDKDYIDQSRSTMGMTLRRTLNDIKETGLISERIYERCLTALAKRSIDFEKDLLMRMARESADQRLYAFHKNEQIEYINKLSSTGLIAPASQQQLISSYGDSSLKTLPEILQYSNRYILVDLTKEDSLPSTTYRIIFDSLHQLIPSFEYADLQVVVTEKKKLDLGELSTQLSFRANGLKYNHTSFYGFTDRSKKQTYRKVPPVRISEDFQKPVNQWLRDQASPYRVYRINASKGNEKDEFFRQNRVGLLLLKEGEAEQVSEDVMMISKESYDTLLSRKNIDRLITAFSANDFFKGLSRHEIDSAKQQLLSSSVNTLGDFLLVFPRTVVRFDWETGNLENPYEQLTRQLAEATRGAVTVTAIRDEFHKGWRKAKKVRYGFVMNGKSFETMLEFQRDWLQPEFLELFQKALDESNAGGRFFQCFYNGQEAGYLFLTTSQQVFINREYLGLLLELD